MQAWNLASSGAPLINAFSGELVTDQYGGLLAVSALVYRVFSPDAHRPYLVVIICAGISALGLPFLVSVARRFVAQKYALIAGWILALFPETLFLGASQMREPFMITAFAVSFWAIATFFGTKKRFLRITGFFIGVLTMFIISTRSAVLLVVFLLIWLWIELKWTDW